MGGGGTAVRSYGQREYGQPNQWQQGQYQRGEPYWAGTQSMSDINMRRQRQQQGQQPVDSSLGFGGTMEYRGTNDPGGTPGYGGQPQTPWQQRQNDPYTFDQYGQNGEIISTQSRHPGASFQQPGSQYYNPYFGGMNQNQGGYGVSLEPHNQGGLRGLPLGGQVGFGQQQPMQINLGALMQQMSNPQAKTPQGPGPGGQMNQMQQRRQPLRPSYMPNTWEAPQMDYSSGGEA